MDYRWQSKKDPDEDKHSTKPNLPIKPTRLGKGGRSRSDEDSEDDFESTLPSNKLLYTGKVGKKLSKEDSEEMESEGDSEDDSEDDFQSTSSKVDEELPKEDSSEEDSTEETSKETQSFTESTLDKEVKPYSRACVPPHKALESRYKMIKEARRLKAVYICPKKLHPDASSKALRDWRRMQKYGFLITSDGCWIHARTIQQSNKDFLEVFGPRWKRLNINPKSRDELNRPNGDQHSHLCHHSLCCNPVHIVVEPEWKNKMRNYCLGLVQRRSFTVAGVPDAMVFIHDCGRDPPCKLPYSSLNHYKMWRDYISVGSNEATQILSKDILALLNPLRDIQVPSPPLERAPKKMKTELCPYCGKVWERLARHVSTCVLNPVVKPTNRAKRESNADIPKDADGKKHCKFCDTPCNPRGLHKHMQSCKLNPVNRGHNK